MGEATGDRRGSASYSKLGEGSATVSDEIRVDLAPADLWVLGQLIEADAASFPPEIEEEILTGYRILKGSGYEPPPSRGHTRVELSASMEPEEQHEPSQPARSATLGEQAGGSVHVREVVLAEITSEPSKGQTAAGATHPEALEAHLAAIGGALDRIAAQMQAASRDRERSRGGVEAAVVDLGLAGLNVLTAVLFVLAAAILGDAVFTILGIGALGLAGFLAAPHLRSEARP